jgi:hypothetical protein
MQNGDIDYEEFNQDFERLFEKGEPIFIDRYPLCERHQATDCQMGGAKFCSGDAYWAAFARVLEDGGNLAILLGKRSHNLCAIDLDRDDLIDSRMPLSFSDHFQKPFAAIAAAVFLIGLPEAAAQAK